LEEIANAVVSNSRGAVVGESLIARLLVGCAGFISTKLCGITRRLLLGPGKLVLPPRESESGREAAIICRGGILARGRSIGIGAAIEIGRADVGLPSVEALAAKSAHARAVVGGARLVGGRRNLDRLVAARSRSERSRIAARRLAGRRTAWGRVAARRAARL